MSDELDFDKLTELLTKTRDLTNDDVARMNDVKVRLNELSREIKALTNERYSLESKVATRKAELKMYDSQLVKAARLREVKIRQQELKAEFESKSIELDELTTNAKWRGYAKDYQIDGGKRLAVAKRGILGDKRGLGKTLSGIIWLDMVQAKRALVIAPSDIVEQFESEIKDWAPNRTIFNLKSQNPVTRQIMFNVMQHAQEFIIMMNYEAWRKDKTIIDELCNLGLDTIMLDEAHRIKSSDKVTARGVFQLAWRPNYCEGCMKSSSSFVGPWENKDRYSFYTEKDRLEHKCIDCGTELSNSVQNILSMTGTPILNKPQEMFSLLFLIDPVAFPSESKFLDDYCQLDFNGRWKFRAGGVERLSSSMSSFFVQRDRDDVGVEVPPPTITIHTLEKDRINYPKQYEAEKALKEKSSMLIEGGSSSKDIFDVLSAITRQRQVMTWPANIVINEKDPDTKQIVDSFKVDIHESQKLDAAMDLLLELCEEGERTIVFSQFKDPLYEMSKRLTQAGYTNTLATGDQTDTYKREVRLDFDLKTAPVDPRWQVCFATYKAFGTGINLNAARQMIMLDDEWNPGSEDQAIGRIDRMNSIDQANVHMFRVEKSIDDFMASLIEQKREITSGFASAISTSDLVGFFNG